MSKPIDPQALEELMTNAGFDEQTKEAARKANSPTRPDAPKRRRTRGHGATERPQLSMPGI